MKMIVAKGDKAMNQSVLKALKLLDLFTEDTYELSLKEISLRSNLPKPTAYRLLSSLEEAGFLNKTKESEHDSRYRLGLKLLDLGQLVADKLEVRKIALPYMQQLGREINEVVHLVVINHGEATYIEKVDSTRALRLYTRVGKSAPLYAGSGPKLLLAYLPEEKQEKIIQLAKSATFPNGKPIKMDELRKDLNQIREEGFSWSSGEQDEDTTGISYPIFDYRNEVVAALGVSGLSTHFTGEHLELIKKKTYQTAGEISDKLGFRKPERI
ncbi:IclR family transcriptional regulator [Virgibacillus kimchii]